MFGTPEPVLSEGILLIGTGDEGQANITVHGLDEMPHAPTHGGSGG